MAARDEAQRRDWLALRFAYLWLNQRHKMRPIEDR